jgi:Flp pilus assembly protein TadD
VAAFLAAGCATTKVSYMFMKPEAWREELSRRGVDVRSVPDPLLVGDGIRQVAARLAGVGTPPERLQRLQHELFDETAFPFRYKGRETYTAMEAFQRREGNCLSFTNLFVAMGRSLGFQVTTALVRRAQATEKEGDLIIVNDHVVAALAYGPNGFYFDFDRRPHERPMAVQPLDDLWITALYLNNRGADELRAAHPDIALRYFDWATKLAPTFAPAWGNFGVARRRTGDINGAFAAYSHALTISPEDPTILGNLASLYRATGHEHEAELALKAINVANATPHTLIVRGDLELAQGHVREAFRLYKRARSLAPRLADPWVALARAELARSRQERAKADVESALRLEPDDPGARALLREISGTAAVPPPR